MAGQSVGTRLENLKGQIERACLSCGRQTSSVHLLAVSKLQNESKIRAAYAHGQRDFAENYVQEATLKQQQLSDLDIRWHFIGRIQSNKVQRLAGSFYAIHSVDRSEIVERLEKACAERGITQNIFLQFNVAAEPTKAGTSLAELESLYAVARAASHVKVLGLMVMPPLDASEEQSRHYFSIANQALVRLGSLHELSMGTSHDYRAAIAEGATWIRIGTDVFGPRQEEQR